MAVTEEKVSFDTDEGYEKFYREAIKAFVRAAEARLLLEMRERKFPNLRDGARFELTYVGVFEEDIVRQLADRAGVDLPMVQLIH